MRTVLSSDEEMICGSVACVETFVTVPLPSQNVHVGARAHVPDADDAVAATRAQDVEGRVDGHGVHARQVAVVVADHFVRFQVPAFDHFVFGAGEEVGVAWGDCEAADCADVACQGEFEGAGA